MASRPLRLALLLVTGCGGEQPAPAPTSTPAAPLAEPAALSPIRTGRALRRQLERQKRQARERQNLLEQAVRGGR